MLDFEKVFQDNQGFIFRYLMKLCGNESLAEELTQESFFRAYMNLTGLRKEEKVTVWLCQIAKNTYFAWYNEQKKLQPLNDTPYFENTQDLAEAFVEKELSAKAYLLLVSLSSKALLGFYRILFCAGHIWENKEEYE